MANLITLGKEFFEWTPQQRIDHLHALASSMNEALDMMQNERNEWRAKCGVAEQTALAADNARGIARKINIDFITKATAEKQVLEAKILHLIAERRKMKDKVRKLENGSINRPAD